MKNSIIIIATLICTSCFLQKGTWTDGHCRPKRPDFKLSGIPFKESDTINFNKVYAADDFTDATGYIFYPDGRLIYVHSTDGFALKPEHVAGKTWDNAAAIGYWRIAGNEIKIETFFCGNSGTYIVKQGKVVADTLFFERYCGTNPFKREMCWDKYVLSDMAP